LIFRTSLNKTQTIKSFHNDLQYCKLYSKLNYT